MLKPQAIFISSFTCFLISSCSMTPEDNFFGDHRVTAASANQMFDKGFEGFTDAQLVLLLDPNNTGNYDNEDESTKIKILRKAFLTANTGTNALAHRAQIQDRLIAASNQRCNLYMTYLKRVSNYTNGIFGTLTTVLGGAGAIVTDQSTARLLSGLSGISSGTRAELTQAIFESIATSVIIPGIQKSRADLLKEIDKKRSQPLTQYTVEGAMADAITYHGACSMDTGIGYAQKSIQSFDDIGISKLNDAMASLSNSRRLSESFMLRPIDSLVVAEKVLAGFAAKLKDYKSRVSPTQKAVDDMITKLTADVKTDGSLGKEAAELDQVLKVVMFNYASTSGADKTNSFSLLEAQQINAKDFARKIEAINTELLIELKKLEQVKT
ncbi:hypothetical protein [Rheinheimera sp.]|uniref:hypothetical protein n=1 Tax=Rheinheimera sp. TaxID=1869214 RepID=UPI00307F6E33